jgi:hypothetical protein
LKLFGVEGGEDFADAIMRRGAIDEGSEPAQMRQLFFTDADDVGERFPPRRAPPAVTKVAPRRADKPLSQLDGDQACH